MAVAPAPNGQNTARYQAVFGRHVIKRVEIIQARLSTTQTEDIVPPLLLKQALHTLDYALKPTTWPVAYPLLQSLSPQMERYGHWRGWCNVLNRAIPLAQPSQAVELNLILARLMFWQSRFPEAVAGYRRTITLARRLNDDYNLARALTNLGFYYVENGHWQRAEILCCRALHLFEMLNSSHGLAHTYNHLGILRLWQEQWPQAEQHLQRATALWRTMGDTPNLLRGLNNLGLLYNSMEQPDKALPFFKEAEACTEAVGYTNEIASTNINIGVTYFKKQDYALSEAYLQQAHTDFKQLDNVFKYAQTTVHLGMLYLEWGGRDRAKKYFVEALKLWQKLNNSYYHVQSVLNMAEYELTGNTPRQAHKWLTLAETLLTQHDAGHRYSALWRRLEEVRQKQNPKGFKNL